jgi:hypothetical protein
MVLLPLHSLTSISRATINEDGADCASGWWREEAAGSAAPASFKSRVLFLASAIAWLMASTCARWDSCFALASALACARTASAAARALAAATARAATMASAAARARASASDFDGGGAWWEEESAGEGAARLW